MVTDVTPRPSKPLFLAPKMPKMTSHGALVTLVTEYPLNPQISASFAKMTNVVTLRGLGHLSEGVVTLVNRGRFGPLNWG